MAEVPTENKGGYLDWHALPFRDGFFADGTVSSAILSGIEHRILQVTLLWHG